MFLLRLSVIFFNCFSILISSQNIILDALSNNDLDIFKKASLALRYLSLIKGKDDVAEKSEIKF